MPREPCSPGYLEVGVFFSEVHIHDLYRSARIGAEKLRNSLVTGGRGLHIAVPHTLGVLEEILK